MRGGYTVVPIELPDKPSFAQRPQRGYVNWQFAKWDFHDDCPDYERELRNTGWIKQPRGGALSKEFDRVLRSVWNAEALESQLHPARSFLDLVESTDKYRISSTLTKPSRWSRIKAWLKH